MKQFIKLITLFSIFFLLTTLSYAEAPFSKGETITYTIKKLGLKVGEASYVFNGLTKINDQKAYLLTFTAKAFNFFDEEKIYFDPQTFFPIAVHRNLNIFGKKEKIQETYFHDKGEILITKKSKGETTTQIIKKIGPIDNLMCFIYRYRYLGKFQEGERIRMNLPTKDIILELKNKRDLKIKGKKQRAYYLQSIPNQYRLWFSTDTHKIPLRIDGALGPLKAKMIIKNYYKK